MKRSSNATVPPKSMPVCLACECPRERFDFGLQTAVAHSRMGLTRAGLPCRHTHGFLHRSWCPAKIPLEESTDVVGLLGCLHG